MANKYTPFKSGKKNPTFTPGKKDTAGKVKLKQIKDAIKRSK